MRTLEVMRACLVLLLLGCSGPPSEAPDGGEACTPLRGRMCSCSSGPGAQLCEASGRWGPCRCLGGDGGQELDAGQDAGAEPDGGHDADVDAGRDAGHDAGRVELDAGQDAGARDAGQDAGRLDAGPPAVCDLVTQVGCGPGLACRRGDTVPSTRPRSGEPRCETAGPLYEWGFAMSTPWRCTDSSGNDLCQRFLFCLAAGVCARFCDPAGTACPPTPWGAPQRCVMNASRAPDPYCEPY